MRKILVSGLLNTETTASVRRFQRIFSEQEVDLWLSQEM